MNYKPGAYRFWDIFFSKFQELPEAEIIKETKKAYLIKYIDQEVWTPKNLTRIKKDKILIDNYFIERNFG